MATLTDKYQLLDESDDYTFNSDYSGKVRIRLYARYSGQSVANNTSLVYVKLTKYLTGSSKQVKMGCSSWAASMWGSLEYETSHSEYASFYAGSEYTIFEKAYTVQHNADGTRSLALGAAYDNSYISPPEGELSISSVTCDLPTIPRASTPVLSDYSIVLGQNVSIYTNAASPNFRHIISYNWYSLENGEPAWVTIATDVQDVVHWRVPLDFAENLTGTDRGTGKIKCETWNGTTRLGTSIIEFEGVVSSTSEFQPEIKSVLINEPTGHIAKYGALVNGYSTLRAKTQAEAKHGASIEKCSAVLGYMYGSTFINVGKNYEGDDITTDPLTMPLDRTDSVLVRIKVEDSRGISTTYYSDPYTLLDYTPPVVTALSFHRCDANGSKNDSGEYVSVKFSATITPLRSSNSHIYTLYYTPMGVEDATTEKLVVDVSNAEDPYNLVDFVIPPVNMDGSYTWSIEIEAKDDIAEPATRSSSVSTAFTLMNWGPDGTSMAIGKVAEKPGTLEVALDLEVTGDAVFKGKVTGSVNEAIKDYVIETGTEAMGTNGTWYWRKWSSGRAECYGRRNFGNMAVSTAWGNMYTSPSFSQALPSGLFIGAPELVNINIVNTNVSGWVSQGYNQNASATSTGDFCVYSATSGNFSKVHFGFQCIGRWK